MAVGPEGATLEYNCVSGTIGEPILPDAKGMFQVTGTHNTPSMPDVRSLDTHRYIELLMRAAETVLTPLGSSRKDINEWVFDNVRSIPLWPNVLSMHKQQLFNDKSLFTELDQKT
jgi:hypothetical protein